MTDGPPGARQILPAARQLVDAISGWRLAKPDRLTVAIDGHGAAGKSVLAGVVSELLATTVVHVDDFFREAASDGIGVEPGERATAGAMAAYYDWERLRREALEPLRAGGRASFSAFDWETNAYLPGVVVAEPAGVILVEGVSSTADAVADLIDRTVLVVTPESERVMRLHERVVDEAWDEQWLAAERRYFAERPGHWFDLVVSGSA
jgi:uridine kinase